MAPDDAHRTDHVTWPAAVQELIEPELVLPAQLLGPTWRGRAEGERSLMLAVLEDGVASIRRYAASSRARHRKLAREAQRWFLSDDDHYPFSFAAICAALGIDAGRVRAGLRRQLLLPGPGWAAAAGVRPQPRSVRAVRPRLRLRRRRGLAVAVGRR
jgi:hypothetical protein